VLFRLILPTKKLYLHWLFLVPPKGEVLILLWGQHITISDSMSIIATRSIRVIKEH
jgi:hypothetical protein